MTASTSVSAATPSSWRRWLANGLLGAGSVLLCLLAFELGARWLVDFRALTGINIYDVDLSNPIHFLPGREHVYQTPEFRYTLKTNRFGRRDREWTEAQLADPGNLLFIGDSFVMGASVEDADSIPTQLEAWTRARGTPREVFNFGMGNTGIPQYLQMLEDALRIGVKARTVLVGVFLGNDFQADSLDRVVQPDSLDRVDRLPPVAAPAPGFAPQSALLAFLKMRVSHSPLTVGWMLQLGDWFGIRLYNTDNSHIFLRHPRPDQVEATQRILAKLGEIQEICARNQRDLAVVIFPNKIQVENHDHLSTKFYDPERPNQVMAEYCRSRGLRCWDQLPVLSAAYAREGRLLYFPVDRHLNAEGNRIAAGSIAASLEHSMGFIDGLR